MTRKRSLTLCAAAGLFWLCLPLPLTPWLSHYNRDFIENVEKRLPATWPHLGGPRDLLRAQTYRRISAFLQDRMPFRDWLITGERRLAYLFFKRRSFGQVDVGRDGWLFIRDAYYRPTENEQKVRQVLREVDYFLTRRPPGEASLLLVIGPDKDSIYPEKMSATCLAYQAKADNRRKLIREFFTRPHGGRVLGLWSAYLREKKTSPVLLFYPKDTHHTPTGALIMCRGIIEAVQPGLWRPEEVRNKGRQTKVGDLSLLAGLGWGIDVVQDCDVVRPGVQLVKRIALDHTGSWKDSARYLSRSDTRPLIPGRTAILHDSLLGANRETLRQFFRDVTFIHYEKIYSADKLQAVMRQYDRVIMEVVERESVGILEKLLDGYNYHVLRELGPGDFSAVTSNQQVKLSPAGTELVAEASGYDPMIFIPSPHLRLNTEYLVWIDLESTADTYCQLFYQTNDVPRFEDAQSLIKKVDVGRNLLTFHLPAGSIWYPLRLDPGLQPGRYRFKAFQYRQLLPPPQGGEGEDIPENAVSTTLFFAWGPVSRLLATPRGFVASDPRTRLENVPAGILVTAAGEDPQISLPVLPDLVAGTQPVLEIDLEASTDTFSQLFYLTPGVPAYREDLSVKQDIHRGENRLRFVLPPESLRFPLRFDPGGKPGTYLLRFVSLGGAWPASLQAEAVRPGMPPPARAKLNMLYLIGRKKLWTGAELLPRLLWRQQVNLKAAGPGLAVQVLGNDPILGLPAFEPPRTEGYYQVSLKLFSPRATEAQLYYLEPGEKNYREEASARCGVRPGLNTLVFLVEGRQLLQPLRLDPACHPGEYRLDALEIEEVTTGDLRR